MRRIMKIKLESIMRSILGVAILALLLSGCGGGGGGSSTSANGAHSGSATSAEITGTAECFSCHSEDLPAASVVSASQVEASSASSNGNSIFAIWRNGPHGNYQDSSHGDSGMYNDGFPSYESIDSDQTCLDCHDYKNDGLGLESYYSKMGISFLGVVNRPIVGCETCHGSGINHFGIGAMIRAPGAEMCSPCHDAGVGQSGNHLKYHPEADRIYEDYAASPHASSINSHNYEGDSTTDVRGMCSKCHTDEGAKMYKDIRGGNLAGALASKPPVENASVVQCRTCHDPHDPDQLLQTASDTESSEYSTCTDCHQTSGGFHGEGSKYSWSGFAVGVGTFDASEIIYDTHFRDDETTPEIEGYNIDPSNERVCRDCHNVHAADTTINEDWADSAHGGHILSTVGPTTGLAHVTETEAPAWTHYDFKGSNRAACQRCHTATGFKNFISDPANYDPANNDFAYLAGEQREMLYCWACHTSSAGNLRDDELFSDISPYSSPASRISAVPDLSGSNICMSCHSGRVSGQGIKDKDLVTEIQGKNFGGFNSHYLAAGGILFRTIGYEYDGLDYENVVYFTHDKIGTTSDTGMGSNGPCVGCHMKSPDGHTFENVTVDGGGHVTDVTAYDNVCFKCHPSKTTLITRLNELHDGYEAALDEIVTLLGGKGIFYGSGYPYFFKAGPKIFPNAFKAWPDKDTIGAAFNLNMLKHIKGYVHNHQYTRKLIYDSIDYLDDGLLNNSVEATLGGSGIAHDYLEGTR